MLIGGQDHFYLEGQIALAIPGEDEDVTVWSSTQHPTEVQLMVAQVLGIAQHAVTVNVRRMGGGFGGKETQGNLFAAVAALGAKKLGRAVKIRPDRDDDMQITGKRHDFVVDYDVGFDDDGRIEAVDAVYAARAGFSADLSGPGDRPRAVPLRQRLLVSRRSARAPSRSTPTPSATPPSAASAARRAWSAASG